VSNEEFLARWSRRKQEARGGDAAPQSAVPTETCDPAVSARTAENASELDVDLSRLPPIESIDAATDITAFLREGIPAELSRAALRRAWTADPAIRDFVGLAENAWDFNDPNAMPGFGPLDYSAEQIDALVGRIVGGVRQVAESLVNSEVEEPGKSVASERDTALHAAESNSTALTAAAASERSTMPIPVADAPQPVSPARGEHEQADVSRPTHGSALPS